METLFGHQEGVLSVDCLQREKPVSCGGRDRSVRLWKVVDESQLVYTSHGESLDCIAMINDHLFVTGDQDGSVESAVWRLEVAVNSWFVAFSC